MDLMPTRLDMFAVYERSEPTALWLRDNFEEAFTTVAKVYGCHFDALSAKEFLVSCSGVTKREALVKWRFQMAEAMLLESDKQNLGDH